MKFTVVKKIDFDLPPDMREALRKYLFEVLGGMSELDSKAWRRFWNRIYNMAAGEIISFEALFPRNSQFHRKYFALINYAFDCWQPNRKHKTYKGQPIQKNFDRFRDDITIQAGYYDVTFDLEGKMILEAESISFAKMEDPEFEELYSATINVILDKVLTNYKDRDELDKVVENVLRFAN